MICAVTLEVTHLDLYKIRYQHNIKSNKQIIKSNIQDSFMGCGLSCSSLETCKGFNIRNLTNGKTECDLLQGYADIFDVVQEEGVTYIEGMIFN